MAWAEADLERCWHALGQMTNDASWRLMPLGRAGGVRFQAGLRMPQGFEAIVAVFPSPAGTALSELPEGAGFDVIRIESDDLGAPGEAIALVRSAEGDIGIFETMAIDVLRTVEHALPQPEAGLRQGFIRRVKAWQDFMARGALRPLSPEGQVGLFGELIMLEALCEGPLGARDAFAAWVGPRHAAQDFHVLAGAVEVKSTTSAGGFAAKINSIEQLDPDRYPIWLCAMRFVEDDGGGTLPGAVERLRERAACAQVGQEFEAGVIFSGYRDDHAHHYGRRLRLSQERCFQVTEAFPSLKRAALSPAVTSARYVLDLDHVNAPSADRDAMFQQLGVL